MLDKATQLRVSWEEFPFRAGAGRGWLSHLLFSPTTPTSRSLGLPGGSWALTPGQGSRCCDTGRHHPPPALASRAKTRGSGGTRHPAWRLAGGEGVVLTAGPSSWHRKCGESLALGWGSAPPASPRQCCLRRTMKCFQVCWDSWGNPSNSVSLQMCRQRLPQEAVL